MTGAAATKGDTVCSVWRIILLKCLDYLCADYPGEVEMRSCYDQGLTPKEALDAILQDQDSSSSSPG